MCVNLQSIGKNVFASKKWTNKIILMNHGTPELSGRLSIRLSFASYGKLIFRIPTLFHHWLHFRFSPGSSFFSPSKPWFMPIDLLKLGSGAMVASVFQVVKHVLKACFMGWHFLTTNVSPRWQLIILLTFCPTYSYIQKS